MLEGWGEYYDCWTDSCAVLYGTQWLLDRSGPTVTTWHRAVARGDFVTVGPEILPRQIWWQGKWFPPVSGLPVALGRWASTVPVRPGEDARGRAPRCGWVPRRADGERACDRGRLERVFWWFCYRPWGVGRCVRC